MKDQKVNSKYCLKKKLFSLRVLAVLSFSTYPPIEKQLENLTKGFTYRFFCNNNQQHSSFKYINYIVRKVYLCNTFKLASAALVFTNKMLILLFFCYKINNSFEKLEFERKYSKSLFFARSVLTFNLF
jgi:hypothetical protein